jgi:hypothetical protein
MSVMSTIKDRISQVIGSSKHGKDATKADIDKAPHVMRGGHTDPSATVKP